MLKALGLMWKKEISSECALGCLSYPFWIEIAGFPEQGSVAALLPGPIQRAGTGREGWKSIT
jgi:hypothetical protein